MQHSVWQSGMAFAPPVYIDTNILVSALVTKHPLYKKCGQLIGELLASGVDILASIVTVHEAQWVLAKISYYELANQPSNAHFSQSIYRKWRERIFEAYAPRMHAVGEMLRDWLDTGVPLAVVPQIPESFVRAVELTPQYMGQFRLLPGDAAHLALAELHAQTFVTADGDFARVVTQGYGGHLSILQVMV